MSTDRTANLADADTFAHLREAFFSPAEFIEHQRHFQSECDRFRVNAVTAANHWRHFVAESLSRGHSADLFQIVSQNIDRLVQLNGQCGVEYVRRSETLMDPASRWTDRCRNVFQKCDDVVISAFLDLKDLGNRNTRLLSNFGGILFCNLAELSH